MFIPIRNNRVIDCLESFIAVFSPKMIDYCNLSNYWRGGSAFLIRIIAPRTRLWVIILYYNNNGLLLYYVIF